MITDASLVCRLFLSLQFSPSQKQSMNKANVVWVLIHIFLQSVIQPLYVSILISLYAEQYI